MKLPLSGPEPASSQVSAVCTEKEGGACLLPCIPQGDVEGQTAAPPIHLCARH